jgi:hypothetical protein
VHSGTQASLDDYLLTDFIELAVDLYRSNHAELGVDDSQSAPRTGEVLGDALMRMADSSMMSRGMTIHPSDMYLWTPGQHQVRPL